MSEEPDFDEAKEWEDLEGEDLPAEDEDLILEQESDDDIATDHGKGYKRPIKVRTVADDLEILRRDTE